jgi:Zn-dependent metalloprotease
MATSAATGDVTFIGGSRSEPLDPPDNRQPSTIARDFVDHYGSLFGVTNPSADLARLDITDTSVGDTAVRFQQTYRGIPVLAGEIAVQVDSDGRVLSTAGEALPAIDIDVTAQVPGTAASELARNLAAKYDDVAADLVTTSTPELWIYDPSLIGADGPPGPRLVWRIDVRTDLGDVDRLVLVDAHSGTVALQFSQRNDALNRMVCTNNNVRGAPQACTAPVRVEGQGPIGGASAADVNSAYDLSGVTYAFYFALGRDSVDGSGLPLKSTVRFCPPLGSGGCPFANAFWNGSQMVYGQGFASADDVVGHELTHGVTDRTSRLLYFAESGAINESMSDVMGELVDLGSVVSGPDPASDRWLIGEQLPGGALRDMSDPTVFDDPDRMTSPLFFSTNADSRGVHINSGVGNKAAFLITDGEPSTVRPSSGSAHRRPPGSTSRPTPRCSGQDRTISISSTSSRRPAST